MEHLGSMIWYFMKHIKSYIKTILATMYVLICNITAILFHYNF